MTAKCDCCGHACRPQALGPGQCWGAPLGHAAPAASVVCLQHPSGILGSVPGRIQARLVLPAEGCDHQRIPIHPHRLLHRCVAAGWAGGGHRFCRGANEALIVSKRHDAQGATRQPDVANSLDLHGLRPCAWCVCTPPPFYHGQLYSKGIDPKHR